MRGLAWLAMAFCTLVVVVIAIQAEEQLQAPVNEPLVAGMPPEAGTLPPNAPQVQAVSPVVQARRVGQGVIASPPVEAGRLERVGPRAPLSELALARPPGAEGPAARLLHRPVADAAGLVSAQGHKIAIAGITIIDADKQCSASDGRTWPCGMVARTAFRQWLRGRALSCTVAEQPAAGTIVSPCRLGEQDVGAWLVQNGWARASGSDYAALEARAKANELGVFGPPPPCLD